MVQKGPSRTAASSQPSRLFSRLCFWHFLSRFFIVFLGCVALFYARQFDLGLTCYMLVSPQVLYTVVGVTV